MSSPLASLIQSGTKLWLDSIDPELVRSNKKLGATGATSNPVIVADLLKSGRFDDRIEALMNEGLSDHDVAWQVTDQLVKDAQSEFLNVWKATKGNDGYVSFEVDPLLEDPKLGPPTDERVEQYIKLGTQWADGHSNRMIKIPATPAGLAALEELTACGIPINVTLIFTMRQYIAARDAVWRGARRLGSLDRFKSVYSIFVSRIDVYTEKCVTELSAASQGQVGIVNAKQIWRENKQFWMEAATPLAQEIVFASTGTKKPEDAPWKYVSAFAGSDIETNPPATNDAVAQSDFEFSRQVDRLPPANILDEIDAKVDFDKLEAVLMDEGIQKFADPQKNLLALIAAKRKQLAIT